MKKVRVTAFRLISAAEMEYANGPVDSYWGAKRAASGHPEPFNLKYLGIGNENWGPEYHQRYEVFQQAIREKHPGIKMITGSGVAYDGPDYRAAWEWAVRVGADENSFENPTKVAPVTEKLKLADKSFLYRFPPYSVTVLRVQ